MGVVRCSGCGATVAVTSENGGITVNHKRRSVNVCGDCRVCIVCDRCFQKTEIVLQGTVQKQEKYRHA